MSMLFRLSEPMHVEEEDIVELMSPNTMSEEAFFSTGSERKTKHSVFWTEERRQELHPAKRVKKSLSFGDRLDIHTVDREFDLDSGTLNDNGMIGDGSRPYSLPTTLGKHPDLKSITHDTMANLIVGRYDDVIPNYRIIDCRYPYEYDGGHIKDAENIFTKDGILQLLEDSCDFTNGQVLVFHCEFSSERAPKLCRFLRNKDRQQNAYPLLNFPEMYILKGGYRQFYQNHQELCEPQGYIPMLHKDHVNDIKRFRSKSKSWTAGEKKKIPLCLFS